MTGRPRRSGASWAGSPPPPRPRSSAHPATRGNLGAIKNLGEPSSYLALEAGAEVYSCDEEEVGKVEHVLRDPDADIFDGLVLDTSALPGGHRFVDADQVEEVFERGVLLKLDRKSAEALPQPSENAATMEADPAEADESDLTRKLRRAWDLISGNY